jgi:hypothetical protein
MKFIPPIRFPVRISGAMQLAYVEEQIGSSEQFILFIRFEDGFHDIFYLDEEGGVYGTKEGSIPYEHSIRRDIGILIGLDSKRFYFVIEEIIDGIVTNVWIVERDTESKSVSYAVYFDNCYRFELIRKGSKWLSFTQSKVFPEINQHLATRVGHLLDNLSKLFIAAPFLFMDKGSL